MLKDVISTCERLICEEMDGFWGLVYPEMISLDEVMLTCLPGFKGTVLLNCMVDPVFGAVHRASGGCTPVYCPPDGEWPSIGGGRSISKNCTGMNSDHGIQMRR